MIQNIIRPQRIRNGDTIRIIAPAGVFDTDRFNHGIRILEDRGYKTLIREDLFNQHRYLAGDDSRRLEELQEAMECKESRAIWCVRGGYGSMRLLANLDPGALLRNQKLFVGFSDITALHSLFNNYGIVTVHGPMVAGLIDATDEAMNYFDRINSGESLFYEWEPGELMIAGECRGRITGGNLSIISQILGTPYQPDFKGSILFLEDVGEAPYRIDRMLTHIELTGLHKELSGVLLGEFTAPDEDQRKECMNVIEERIKTWNIPAVSGFPAGHGKLNYPLPLGIPVELDCNKGNLKVPIPVTV